MKMQNAKCKMQNFRIALEKMRDGVKNLTQKLMGQ